jgi:hypothetical protein
MMENPGSYTIFAGEITTTLTGYVGDAIIDLSGMTAVTLVAKLAYGSGGTSIAAKVQTTLDGTVWFDVARFDFTTSGGTLYANLSGLTAKASAAYAALSAEGVNDGLLGDRLRASITSVGTYAGSTTLDIRASVR